MLDPEQWLLGAYVLLTTATATVGIWLINHLPLFP